MSKQKSLSQKARPRQDNYFVSPDKLLAIIMNRRTRASKCYSVRHKRRIARRQTDTEIRNILHDAVSMPIAGEDHIAPPICNSNNVSNVNVSSDNEEGHMTEQQEGIAEQNQWQWRQVESNSDDDCSVHSFGYPSSTSSDEDEDTSNHERSDNDFIDAIDDWMRNYVVSREACNALLRILIMFTCVQFPKDCRTLLRTPCSTTIVPLCQGQYWHSGLEKAIINILRKRIHVNISDTFVNLFINIDGVPLGKSSTKCLWPILCSDDMIKDVDVIGVYFGEGKPANANEFLCNFVEEAIKLINDGIIFENTHYLVRIKGFICDTPAKSYILQIVSHNGYYSCTKCGIRGDYVARRLCFPGSCNIQRTDEGFANFAYDVDYQKSPTCLVNIPHLGLVTHVPLDYMHLICLGVMRKLIHLWLSGPKNKNVRLPANSVDRISNRLVGLGKWMPSDFNRKPRSLACLKYWKATELRSFVLYLGPIVLHGILKKTLYEHFLSFHVALVILASPVLSSVKSNVDYADALLIYFVTEFEKLYGREYVSHNVHNLYHLAEDVRKYGHVDEFGAFRFENCIGILARLVRKGEFPLQQIHRKLTETKKLEKMPRRRDDNVRLIRPHRIGILPRGQRFSEQFQIMEKGDFFISIEDNGNNCAFLYDGTVVEAMNFVTRNGTAFVIGQEFSRNKSLYHTPVSSSELFINVAEKSNNLNLWPCAHIAGKVMKLPMYNDNDERFAMFPILHTVPK